MRKIIIILLLSFIIISKGLAQNSIQTTMSQSQISRLLAVDSALIQRYQFSKENPFFLEKLMPNKYNNLTIKYDFDKGHYIPVQGSTKTQTISLFSEGKTILERFHLYGSFHYQRSTEDSTRWAHQSRFNNNSPYYFGSIKNNHYERSVYKINTAISRTMLGENLPISLGLDYRIGNHFSNNDPRGDVKDFQLNINPGIGYNITKAFQLGIGYQYGYGREQIGVGYKNSSYFENTVGEIFTNYLITGYGGAQIVQTKNLLRYENNQERQFGKIYANYALTNKDNIIFALKKGEDVQLFKRNLTDAIGFNEFMTYKIERTSADLMWFRNTEIGKFNLALNYNYDGGKGYDNELAGTNFTNEQEYYGLKFYYSAKSKNGLTNNLNFGIQHFEDIKKEGNNLVDISYSRIAINAGYGINKQFKGERSLGAAIFGKYSFKNESSLYAPIENENIFYQHVIYPDYQFNTSDNFSLGLSADYSFPTYKDIQTSIRVSGNYIQRVGDYVELQRTVLNTPGKDRFSSNISLNLYF